MIIYESRNCVHIMKILLLFFVMAGSLNAKAQLTPFYAASVHKYGYRDSTGREIVSPRYDLAYTCDEGMAAVKLNGKYGFLDGKGVEIVQPRYDFAWRFIGGFAAVKLDGKTGFIDMSGKEVIPPVYEDANNYHGTCCYKGMAHVKENGKWKIIKL
jgi:hypothetical protein